MFSIPTDQGFSSGDSITLKVYSEKGSLEGAYSFIDEENASDYGLTKTGWYPLAMIQKETATDKNWSNNVVIPYGKGVLIYNGEGDTSLTYAGQVASEDTTFKLTSKSFVWTGNVMPIDLKLGDFAIPTDQGFNSGDSITLKIYTEKGALEGAYSFIDEENATDYGLTKTGWYPLAMIQKETATDDDCANETVTIPAGKMVLIYNGENDTTLTIPCAMPSAK